MPGAQVIPRVNGRALRILREQLWWSINALAIEVGISRSHLCRAELGERDLSKATAQRIAGVLGLPMSAFMVEEQEATVA